MQFVRRLKEGYGAHFSYRAPLIVQLHLVACCNSSLVSLKQEDVVLIASVLVDV